MPITAAPTRAAKANQGVAAQPRTRSLLGIESVMRAHPAPRADNRIIVPPVVTPESDTEAFANAPTNPLKVTSEDPVSTFSIDVDTASYSVVRSSLMSGHLPPREAVRVEEIINYFPYAYPAPEGAHPFQPTISVTPTPWNKAPTLSISASRANCLPSKTVRP